MAQFKDVPTGGYIIIKLPRGINPFESLHVPDLYNRLLNNNKPVLLYAGSYCVFTTTKLTDGGIHILLPTTIEDKGTYILIHTDYINVDYSDEVLIHRVSYEVGKIL